MFTYGHTKVDYESLKIPTLSLFGSKTLKADYKLKLHLNVRSLHACYKIFLANIRPFVRLLYGVKHLTMS